jgi:cell division protein FtsW
MALSRLLLLLTASAIFSLGVIMIFSTTSAEILELELDKSTHQAIVKQFCYAIAGLGLAWCIVKSGYQRLLIYSKQLLIIFSFLLLFTLIPGIGKEVNGSKRWLNILGLSFQPSEFVKYIVPAFFIHHYLKYAKKEFHFFDFIKLVGFVSVPMFLILIEPNNGTTAVIALTLVALFFLARIHFRYWAWPILAFILVAGVFAMQLDYVSARLKVYLHPEFDLKGKGHQPYQAKIAAGSGGLLGKGPGNSLQKR